jgi:Na+/H+ antiporter NhaD/arsenite permease-like protein
MTTAQMAGLTTDQIVALTTDQVSSLKTSQLSALKTAQMAAMETSDLQVLGTAQIVFFLIGAMTIVEVVDAHNGFAVITERIRTTRLSSLMWLVGFVTFFLSSILDNLTTTIVMVSLMKKLLDRRDDRLFFAGIIVIAANAGGAWTPIGDVTTTMLWIGGQITTLAIMKSVFIPSLANLLVPLCVVAYVLRGQVVVAPARSMGDEAGPQTTAFERQLMFYLGLGVLVAVPVFKTWTHLPPFMGILFGLGLLWLVADLLHRNKDDGQKDETGSLFLFLCLYLYLFLVLVLAQRERGLGYSHVEYGLG